MRERLRNSCRPEDLRVLFVGESPPDGGTFFYTADSILFRATREAFSTAIPLLANTDDFLARFQKLGCYLEDLSHDPICKLPRKERRRARNDARLGLARRLRRLPAPKCVVVVVMGIEQDVRAALNRAGMDDLPVYCLRFPVHRWRESYVSELTGHVRAWRRRGLLNPA